MKNDTPIPRIPGLAQRFVAPVPPPIVGFLAARLMRQAGKTHPELFARLGEHAHKRYEIAPSDLPFVFLMTPDPAAPQLRVLRAGRTNWDCRISGSLAALLGMIHGAYDGDALFFSRDITVEGDTAAGLALRNAIDNSELDLFAEATALLGPLGTRAMPVLASLLGALERRTGVALRRVEI
jgi:O2-independent ubiquinone biosynthesis accessory factor UbiT